MKTKTNKPYFVGTVKMFAEKYGFRKLYTQVFFAMLLALGLAKVTGTTNGGKGKPARIYEVHFNRKKPKNLTINLPSKETVPVVA